MSSLFEKPFALFMGPQRAGANVIYDALELREDVCLPVGVKETFFFDRHYHRGVGFYANHFPVRHQHRLIAEVTTTVFDHPDSPKRVHEIFGRDVKLICPLRNPVERSCAVYEDYCSYGIVKGSIEEAVEQAPQILFASRYADHLERWMDIFGTDSVHIMLYEDAAKDEDAYLHQLMQVLGLGDHVKVQAKNLKHHIQNIVEKVTPSSFFEKKKKSTDKETHLWLQHRLLPEVLKLENLLGRTFPAWK